MLFLISFILAAVVTTFVLPKDYRGGGGAMMLIVCVLALAFRFLIGVIFHKPWKKDKI
jgi:biotin transporter BioY